MTFRRTWLPRAQALHALPFVFLAACGGPLEGEEAVWADAVADEAYAEDAYVGEAEALVVATVLSTTASTAAAPAAPPASAPTTAVMPVTLDGTGFVVAVGITQGDSSPDPIPARLSDVRDLERVRPTGPRAADECQTDGKDGSSDRDGRERCSRNTAAAASSGAR